MQVNEKIKYYYSTWREIIAVNIAGDWIGLRNADKIDRSGWERLSLEDAPVEALKALAGDFTLPAEDIFPELAFEEESPINGFENEWSARGYTYAK